MQIYCKGGVCVKERFIKNTEGAIKLSLTTLLLIYSLVIAIVTKNLLIFLAMLLSTKGDIFIMTSRGCLAIIEGEENKQFEKGVVEFGMSHLVYIATLETEFSMKLFWLAVPIVVILICLRFISNYELQLMATYAVILLMNFANSIDYSWVAAVGAGLFIVSDGILAICEKRNPKWQIAIWATYVPAQILLITSTILK